MKIETMLPLGKLDPGLRAAEAPLDIGAVAADARHAEALGYDGVLAAETKDDPYIVMALAAQATERVGLATAVAIAFPRSPMVTALSAFHWDIGYVFKRDHLHDDSLLVLTGVQSIRNPQYVPTLPQPNVRMDHRYSNSSLRWSIQVFE